MSHVLDVWLKLLLCLVLIGASGPELSRSGEIISAKTGAAGHWVGLILLGVVTSLPELVTGASSVAFAAAPDIAVGDLLGSCVFNLAILGLLDLVGRHGSIYGRASPGHLLSAGYGVLLIGIAGIGILARGASIISIGRIGIYTPIIVLIYALSVRSVFAYEKRMTRGFARDVADRHPHVTLRAASLRYVGAAAVIVLAGAWLPFIGIELSDTMGWQRSFVGTLVVAGVTSAPELVVTLAALRLGALDMAVANVMGSNLFNMAALAIDDVLFPRGPLLSYVSRAHAVSAFSAIVMTGLVMIALIYRPKEPRRSMRLISVGLLLIYVLNSILLYHFGASGIGKN